MQNYEDVLKFVEEENIRFIRLAFFDVFGNQKNIAIMPGELQRAFRDGISFDASAIAGFGEEVRSDLFLKPDPETLSIVPWRPVDGGVCRASAVCSAISSIRTERRSSRIHAEC